MCNTLSHVLIEDFQLSAEQLSLLPSSFLLADVLFLFPAGIILDRVSIRKTTLIMLTLSIIGTLGFALTDSFYWACFFRFMSGIAHAFCFLCCVLLASRWFPPRMQALVIGLMVTIAMLGGLVAQTPLAYLADWLSWRKALLLDSLLGVIILIMAWAVVEDYPGTEAHKYERSNESETIAIFFQKLKLALSNSQTWLYGIYTGLLNLPIMLLGALWGVMYLTEVHQVSKEDAANISMMIYLGTIIGAPLAGWLSDRWGKRRTPMIWGAVISTAILCMILYGPILNTNALIGLFLLMGIVTSAQVISYPAIRESSVKTISGTSMGLASVLIMGLGMLSQPLTGKLLDYFAVVSDGKLTYSAHAYVISLSVITIGFAIALLCAIAVRETNCKSTVE